MTAQSNIYPLTTDRITVIKGHGAQALRDAASAGLIAHDVQDDVIRTLSRNEELERENRILRAMADEKDAQLKEHRQVLLARCRLQEAKRHGKHRRDYLAGYVIIGGILGCVLTSFVFCGAVVAGWFG